MTSIIDALAGITRLGLDTAIFIYFVEWHSRYVALARGVFALINSGQMEGHSTVLTLTETLTYPKRIGNRELEESYRHLLLNTRNLKLWETTATIADTAADLRARYNLRTPDAIQIATALAAGCEAFVTNDRTLRRVTELRIVVLEELTLTTE